MRLHEQACKCSRGPPEAGAREGLHQVSHEVESIALEVSVPVSALRCVGAEISPRLARDSGNEDVLHHLPNTKLQTATWDSGAVEKYQDSASLYGTHGQAINPSYLGPLSPSLE
jgi:hypothetical protein